MSFFTGLDANKDGKLTADELAGNPMADRMKQLDKDGDKAVSRGIQKRHFEAVQRGTWRWRTWRW